MAKELRKINLNEIKDPSFLKDLSFKELSLLCSDIREEIIDFTSVEGGHLASNLGAVELTVALYRFFSFPKDKLIFDVGHQSYTQKILTGRSLRHMGEKGATSTFLDMNESPYDQYDAGHSSTSLSAAFAYATARDNKKENYDVVALIGDSSISNGLAMEAVNQIGSSDHKVIIVLNDNDMSISRSTGSIRNLFRRISTGKAYNKTKSGYRRVMEKTAVGRKIYKVTQSFKNWVKRRLIPSNVFENFGFTYIGPIDGHDIKAISKALKRAKNSTKSVVIHCNTQKGKGYAPAEKDDCGYWHGVTPFDKDSGEPLFEHPGCNSWSHIFGDMVYEAMEERPEAYLVCPAMAKGSHMDKAMDKFPNRSHDAGISEEHSLTYAGALALNGYHPIISVYSSFLQRAYDELSHDVARFGVDATLLIDRAGLIGKTGKTHSGIYDEAYLKSIPGVTLAMPSSLANARALFEDSFTKGRGIYAIRYPHEFVTYDGTFPEKKIEYLSPEILRVGDNGMAIVAVGPKGLAFLEKMREKGFKGTLIDPVFLNPISPKLIEALKDSSKVFIYDPYGTKEGFASSLLSALLENGYAGQAEARAIPNVFVPHDTISGQEKEYGLDLNSVISASEAFFSK